MEKAETTNEEKASPVIEEVEKIAEEASSPPEKLEASEEIKNSKTETEEPVAKAKVELTVCVNEEVKAETAGTEQSQVSEGQTEIEPPAEKSAETKEAAIQQEPQSNEAKQDDKKEDISTGSSPPVRLEADQSDTPI